MQAGTKPEPFDVPLSASSCDHLGPWIVCSGGGPRHLTRQAQAENRLPRAAAHQHHLAAMLGCDRACDREAKACAFLFACTHKRREEAFTDCCRNACTIVRDRDDDVSLCALCRDMHASRC